ncbi:DUF5788 family protein [Methanolobus profundi]|uniref:Uncharacterized protein n=1 Tax=Methanolobus profundi TaxID=487685 RepID=A0A1I4QTJ9_9EURY|nr:DUF5788 family protein [Methanolobus profundi]SFM43394.1 hypothetical protein SAMN04488696_1192 [Methanolobus profundi]
MTGNTKEDMLSEWERKQLLAALHARLFWVGEEVPYSVEIKGKKCRLHDIVWELINKDELTDEDIEHIDKYVSYLREKEKEDELDLKTKELTRKEAKALFNETAGLLRAIMDLREIEDGTAKEKEKEFEERFSQERVIEARRWLQFLKDAGTLE